MSRPHKSGRAKPGSRAGGRTGSANRKSLVFRHGGRKGMTPVLDELSIGFQKLATP